MNETIPVSDSKVIIITGASDGIGAAAAEALHAKGEKVVIVGRSPEKTKRIAEKIGVPYHLVDFSRFSDVRRLAAELQQAYPHIDVLANNAGGVMGSTRALTDDGFEMTLQVNHLGPFLLTNLLMDTLIASHATVINTSSAANRMAGKLDPKDLTLSKGYSKFGAYGKSKLMNILFAKEIAKRHAADGIHAAAFHPGVVRTNFSVESGGVSGWFYKSFIGKFMLTPAQGADTLVWLATSRPGTDWKSGEYYAKRKIAHDDSQAENPELAAELWSASANAVGLK